MIKEHLVGASVTNGPDCICNPEILLGTNHGLWDIANERAPKGALMDLNAAWELFLSRKGLGNLTFDKKEHYQREVIDGILYEEGDITYTLKDDKGNLTNATFTIKANKGPITHIEWENGKLYLYYTKQRVLTDEDLESGAPIHYVRDEEGNIIIDLETGKPLIYDYVAIPIIEIFDNEETLSLFPWFADDEDTVRLRTSIEGKEGSHLGRFAITNLSEVFIAKEPTSSDNVDLVSVLSVQKQLNTDLGFKPTLVPDESHQSPDGLVHNYKAKGSNLSEVLSDGFSSKNTVVESINENLLRTQINTLLIANKIVENDLEWSNILQFADSIKNHAFVNVDIPNLLDALNWIQTAEIGPFKENIDPKILNYNSEKVLNITEALNSIFKEAENNRDRIGYDRNQNKWIDLTTDKNTNLSDAINEVDEHIDALANIIQVTELVDPITKKTYYSNSDLNNITKNRLRQTSVKKDDVTIIESINELLAQIGNLESSKSGDQSYQLTTDNKESLVKAINEVDLNADNNSSVIGATYNKDSTGARLGDITNLETNNKTSLVGAINELDSRVGDLEGLDTDDLGSLVDAVNEIIKESPFIYQDTENDNSGVILKNQNNSAGDYSLVVGNDNNTQKHSFISGSENSGLGDYTLLNGKNNSSKKDYNLISGKQNNNDGNYNLINGSSNIVKGNNNLVNGDNNNVNVNNSTVSGKNISIENSNNIIALGDTLTFKEEINNSIGIGKSSNLNGNKSISIGTSNNVSEESITIGNNNETKGPGNVSVGDNNYIGCDNSYTFGNANRTEGDHTYVQGENNIVIGNNNYVIGKNLKVTGNDNVIIGNNGTVETENAIIIGEFNEPKNNSTNIGREIFIQTHNTESNLQSLIFVDLNDWCKKNNSASLNGEKFLDVLHLVGAIKVYKSKNYTDLALLRFKMQTDNENGFVLIQGKSTRVYLNGSWYFSDNIENGWSRHEGEYLKVIKKVNVDLSGNQLVKHYLAFMDLLSIDAVVDTIGGQRSNTEDFSTIDLTHAYGAVDIEDIETAMNLKSRFNNKVDKYAKIITKYLDLQGLILEKSLNFINPDNSEISNNIVLDLIDSFGFDKSQYQLKSEKGNPNGYVPLDSNGKINSDYLPSYIDDVIDVWAEYVKLPDGNLSDILLYKLIKTTEEGLEIVRRGEPILSGEQGTIYVEALPNSNKISYLFRWTGTKFVPIGSHIMIGEVEGTAFDGGKGKLLEDSINDHIKSGTTTIPVIDEQTGELKIDENGNPMWVVYKPNPHNVTAKQLSITVNDPNNINNVELDDPYFVEHTVDSAIKELFERTNKIEDRDNINFSLIGSTEDFNNLDNLDDELGNQSPTLISIALENREFIKSLSPIDDVENLVNTHFILS